MASQNYMNLPLQQQQEEKNQEQLHIDSVCDLPVQMRQDVVNGCSASQSTNQMHLDLFKPHHSQNLLCDSPSSKN